jgi:hypothetical protein
MQNYSLVAASLRQAAMEIGDAYSNKRIWSARTESRTSMTSRVTTPQLSRPTTEPRLQAPSPIWRHTRRCQEVRIESAISDDRKTPGGVLGSRQYRTRAWTTCFDLEAEFAVADLLYKRELVGFGGAELVARGLRVVELTKEELGAAQAIRSALWTFARRCLHVSTRIVATVDFVDRVVRGNHGPNPLRDPSTAARAHREKC